MTEKYAMLLLGFCLGIIFYAAAERFIPGIINYYKFKRHLKRKRKF